MPPCPLFPTAIDSATNRRKNPCVYRVALPLLLEEVRVLGGVFVLELAREGAKVVVADMQEAPKIGKFHETEPQPPTAEVIAGEGGEALFVETDVADEKAVENLIARSVERFWRGGYCGQQRRDHHTGG